MNTYGKPNEIWIRTYSTIGQFDNLTFEIALFYPEIGLTVAFTTQGEISGDLVRGCPHGGGSPLIGVWDPADDLSFLEAGDVFRWYQEGFSFLPLEEASQIDVTEFYEMFMSSSSTACIETPAELWPSQ